MREKYTCKEFAEKLAKTFNYEIYNYEIDEDNNCFSVNMDKYRIYFTINRIVFIFVDNSIKRFDLYYRKSNIVTNIDYFLTYDGKNLPYVNELYLSSDDYDNLVKKIKEYIMELILV